MPMEPTVVGRMQSQRGFQRSMKSSRKRPPEQMGLVCKAAFRQLWGLLWGLLMHSHQFWCSSIHLATTSQLDEMKGVAPPQNRMSSSQRVRTTPEPPPDLGGELAGFSVFLSWREFAET